MHLQIYHEAKVEEGERPFVAQAFAGGMKHGGGSRRGSTKPKNWPGGGGGGKTDRDHNRRDKDRYQYRERDRDRDRDKPKEKLDARKLQLLLKYREKKDLGVGLHVCVIRNFFQSGKNIVCVCVFCVAKT